MSSNIVTKSILIEGMTCINCENRIENKLQNTKGIINAKVAYSSGMAIITFDCNEISFEEIVKSIEQLDYKVAKEIQERNEVKEEKEVKEAKEGLKVINKLDIMKLIGVCIILLALFLIINQFGVLSIFNIFPQAKIGMGFGMLFVIGLLTSIHCIAMCGGINLSQCIQQDTDNKNAGKLTVLRNSMLYNVGRVISYTVVGGIVGAVGSVVSFSGTSKGIVQLAAGVFMVIMGLNMLNIFPWLRKYNLRMPKIFAKKINEQKKSKNPLYVGLLNGLMPCGPLQAMQLYALSTGDPFRGALSMFIFSLGTVPLMFGLGALSSFLTKKFTKKMMTASAALVVILGLVMFSNGMSLSGIAVPSIAAVTGKSSQDGTVAKINNDVQTVTTKLSSGQYEPITVQKGIPVKWTIQVNEGNLNGCNNEIVIPKFKIQKKLEVGDNIIEFTPTENGTFAYSCWMGMIRSKIAVVDDVNSGSNSSNNSSNEVNYKIPTDKVAVATIKDGEQFVEIDMNETRFTPAVVIIQRGLKTTWTINGKKITSSNSSLLFPRYYAKLDMQEGENPVYLEPDVDFDFSTSDYSFYGYVKVVDDIENIDIKAIKEEVNNYVPTKQEVIDDSGLPSCH